MGAGEHRATRVRLPIAANRLISVLRASRFLETVQNRDRYAVRRDVHRFLKTIKTCRVIIYH